LLLSHILLLIIVAPSRELANTPMFESYNPLYNILNYLNTTSKFIEYNKTRDRNSIVQDTNITTRSQSTSSYISIASSIDYTTQIEAQNNSWAE